MTTSSRSTSNVPNPARRMTHKRVIKRSMALEPRVLLDAAAADTAVKVAAASTGIVLDAAASTVTATHEVVFIDGAVANLDQVLQGIDLQRYDVHLLDGSQDGLAQIADVLAGTQDVSAVHIISHGADGAVQLGNLVLTADNLSAEQAYLARIGQSLQAGADILLYGCDIAADDKGMAFVDSLSGLTGRDVAASDDVTGISGNWSLEYHQGLVQANSLNLPDYSSDLNLDGVSAGTVQGVASQEFGSYVDADGMWVVASGGNTSVSGGPTVTVWAVSGTTRTPYTITSPAGSSTSFGQGVAIDATAETLVIADPAAGTNGNLYIYKIQRDVNNNITGWGLVQTISVANAGRIGASSSGFGKDYLAISGNHIIVGAPNEGGNSGRVDWYSDTSSGNWSTYNSGYFDEPETLNSDTDERFGTSVAIAGDYMIVSSAGADTNGNDGFLGTGNQGNFGRVYVYNWTANATTGPGGALNGTNTATRYSTGSWSYLSGQDDMDGLNGGGSLRNQYFGASLAMDFYGGKYTIAIGGPGDGSNDGKVYVYQTTNSDMATLGANADTTKDGAIGIYNLSTANSASRAGSSVDVSQGRIIVGAYAHTTTAQNSMWYFEAPNNNWNVLQSTNNDVDASVSSNLTSKGILFKTFSEGSISGHTNGTDRMGYSVALAEGNTVVVGSPYYNSGAGGAVGAVDFIYMRTPVATNDTDTITEDANTTAYRSIDILLNDLKGTETVGTVVGANTFTVSNVSVNGFGDAYWDTATNRLMYRQGEASAGVSNYNYLAQGETAKVTISYKLTGDDFSSTATVTITITGVNDAPVFVAGSIPTLSGNRTIDTNGATAGGVANGGTAVGYFTGDTTQPSYQIQPGSFTDVDLTNTLTYSLDATATSAAIAASGSSVAISAAGKITWNLTSALALGTYNIGVKATDNSGGTVTGIIQFTVLRDDSRPQTTASLPSGNAISWTQNAASSQSVTAWFTDADVADEALSYSISYTGPGSSSGWLSIRSDTGLLQGTPSNDNIGATTVIVTATDKYGQLVNYTLTLNVLNVNDAPIAQGTIDPLLAGQGTAFSYQIPGWTTTGSLANQADDLFVDPDTPGSTITYTAAIVDAAGNVLRTLGTSASGSAAGSWLTFNGGTYNPTTFATSSSTAATFGGTSTDAIGTKLIVRVFATDSGTSWNGSSYGADPKVSSYDFTIQTFAPTISIGPLVSGSTASELGTAVSISRDGLYMVAGSPNAGEEGGLTTYFWNGTAWAAMATAFTTPGAVVAGDRFGQSIALDYNGDRMLVGAPGTANGAGTVYAFTRTGTGTASTWTLAATYTEAAATRVAGDGFGTALAFYTDSNNTNDGQSFIVGAPFDSDVKPVSGKAFLFGWAASGTVTSTAANTLSPTTDAGDADTSYDMFGYSIAFDGNITAIGSPYDTHDGDFMAGSVTVVGITNQATATPTFTAGVSQKITRGTASVSGDMFGFSVDLDLFDGLGNAANTLDSALLVVGTPGSDALADDAGAVYVYRADNLVASANRATALNVTPTEIKAYDGRSYQYFGMSVSVAVAGNVEVGGTTTATNRLLIGSQQAANSTGSVYMYKYTTAWNGQRFAPTAGAGVVNGMEFGRSVDIATVPTGTTPTQNWVAGAPYAGASSYDGRIYTGTASQATALSLDAGTGGSGGLVPMSTTTSSTTTTTADSTATSSFLVPLSTTTSTTSLTDTSLSSTSTTTQSLSDILLMDLMTMDPLATGTTTAACDPASTACVAMNDSTVIQTTHGLSRQLHLMQGRREHGIRSLLGSLDKLAS